MTEPLYCANHPTRETMLRCNRCEKPICSSCAIHTPTGYRCQECVNAQKKKFDTAEWHDYIVGVGVTSAMSLSASIAIVIGSLLTAFVPFLSFWITAILSIAVANGSASLTGKIVKRFLGGRRSKNLFIISTVGVVFGALPVILFYLYVGNLFSLIWQGIYLFVAVPAVYYYLSGFRL